MPGQANISSLLNYASLIEWRNGVLRGENRVQIIERRVRDELDSRVQKRCAVRARIGWNPLVVDADPRLGVPALPEGAQVAEHVGIRVEIEEGIIDGGEVRELEAQVEVRMPDVARAAANYLNVRGALVFGRDRRLLILIKDRDALLRRVR